MDRKVLDLIHSAYRRSQSVEIFEADSRTTQQQQNPNIACADPLPLLPAIPTRSCAETPAFLGLYGTRVNQDLWSYPLLHRE